MLELAELNGRVIHSFWIQEVTDVCRDFRNTSVNLNGSMIERREYTDKWFFLVEIYGKEPVVYREDTQEKAESLRTSVIEYLKTGKKRDKSI